MKKILILALLFVSTLAGAQVNNIYATAGIAYTVGPPTFQPGARGAMVAIDTVTNLWYLSHGRTNAVWEAMGSRLQVISGCSAPAYTPAKYQSKFTVNACATPELYYWTGAAWVCLNCSVGGTNLTWTEVSATLYKLNSSSGSDVFVKEGTGVTAALSGDTLTITGTGTTYSAGTGIAISGGNAISNTGDLSTTNEIQSIDTFSVSGSTVRLSLSSDGVPANTITLPADATLANKGATMSGDTVQLGAAYINNAQTPSAISEQRVIVGKNTANGRWGALMFNNTTVGSPVSMWAAVDSANLASAVSPAGNGTANFAAVQTYPTVAYLYSQGDAGAAAGELYVWKDRIGFSTFNASTSNQLILRNDSTSVKKRISYESAIDTSTFTKNTLVTKDWVLGQGFGTGSGTTNLSISGTSSPLTLNSSTGTDVTITASTGITLAGTASDVTITNSAPDQTVSITGGGINVATGTYPNFTVTGTEVDGSTTNEIQQIDTFEIVSNVLRASLSSDGVPFKSVDLSPYVNVGTDLSVSGTSSPVTLNSSTGTDVTITAAGINTLTGTAGDITITGTEVDGSTTNEIQTYGHAGTTTYTNTLSNGGGAWSITGAGIAAISNTAGAVTVTATEVDGSTTNEIQQIDTFEIVSNVLRASLSSDGVPFKSVDLSPYANVSTDLTISGTSSPLTLNSSTGTDVTLTAGTGITLAGTAGNATITNSAPDQTVSITGAGINVTTGTYPTFTVTGTEVDGSVSNELQTITSTSDATSHTVTLSNTGGSVQLVEGTGVTLTTTGTGAAGIVTIAATGTGDITNGGNTTGAAVTIGTNDAFGLNLETNNVTRLSVTGGASTGGAFTATDVTANTNTVETAVTIQANSTGTAAAGFGGGILFQGESTTTNNRDMAGIKASWQTATDASRKSLLALNVYSTTSAVELLKLDASQQGVYIGLSSFTPALYKSSGITASTAFTIESSSTQLLLQSSTGLITILNGGSGNIEIYNDANTVTSASGIVIGNATAFAQTSGTRNYINYNSGFAPTSGTAIHNQLSFTGTLNQSGGASGIVRGINLAHTVTAVADYRAIEIADNGTNVKGVYQTGSTTTNNLVGKTAFGATTAPTDAITVTGNIRAITGQTWSDRFTLTDGATIAIDFQNGNTQSVVLAGNRTITFANPKDGAKYTIILTQDGTGNRTITWPTVKWAGGNAPNLTNNANRTDIVTLIYDGTSYYGTASLNFF